MTTLSDNRLRKNSANFTYDNLFHRSHHHSHHYHCNVERRERTSDFHKWILQACSPRFLKFSNNQCQVKRLSAILFDYNKCACLPHWDSSLPSLQSAAPSQIHLVWIHFLLSAHSHSFLRHFGGGGVGLVEAMKKEIFKMRRRSRWSVLDTLWCRKK